MMNDTYFSSYVGNACVQYPVMSVESPVGSIVSVAVPSSTSSSSSSSSSSSVHHSSVGLEPPQLPTQPLIHIPAAAQLALRVNGQSAYSHQSVNGQFHQYQHHNNHSHQHVTPNNQQYLYMNSVQTVPSSNTNVHVDKPITERIK